MSDKDNELLVAYQKAINGIDDYFEYAMESKRDQRKVRQILAELTDRIVTIMGPQT